MADTPQDTDKERAERIAAARREHDRINAGRLAMFSAVSSFASEAMKSAALVSGGSAAAMLAFIGTGRQPVTIDTIYALKLFGFGLIAASTASGATYAAQYLYLKEMYAYDLKWEYPHIRESRLSNTFRRVANIFHFAAFALVVGSYICAIVGLIYIAGTLIPLPAKP